MSALSFGCQMNQYNDLKSLDRSALEVAKSNFFASGGKVEELQTFEFKPLPPRIEPQLTQEEIELRQMADQIRTLSATMFKLEMSKTLGISQDRIQKICKQFGINLRNGIGKSPGSSNANPAEDKVLVERIKALAQIGLSKHKVQAQVGIGRDRMGKLVKTYGIAFPGPSSCE